jgi:malate synthase
VTVVHAPVPTGVDRAEVVLTPEALAFVAELHRRFEGRRRALLTARDVRLQAFDGGSWPSFRSERPDVRADDWRVAPAPSDLEDRRVEITGPPDRKMMINALNSGAKVFMADCEDALSPTWSNILAGQVNLRDAVRRDLSFTDPASGKHYALDRSIATLVVRPRGWHLLERHVEVDGEAVAGALFDAGMYLFHNASEALARGSGPYFYLPKLESSDEAKLWNDVFVYAQERLAVPRGSVRATVLIETILAAFEMEEILFELREHASGLNAGRWDYIFSFIKTFRGRPGSVLPDRSAVTMAVPFMAAYADLLVQTCHRRGAHAIGGMAAFIPNRRRPEVTEHAIRKVREDKEREALKGFDGTWVAHPDLVPVAREVFDAVLGAAPHQKRHPGPQRIVAEADLLDARVEDASVTRHGVRTNVRVALQYIAAWLGGLGAVAIDDLMEDAATAEISRAQLWQWIRAGTMTSDGALVNAELYRVERAAALRDLAGSVEGVRVAQAALLLDELVLSDRFERFLTLPAYEMLTA